MNAKMISLFAVWTVIVAAAVMYFSDIYKGQHMSQRFHTLEHPLMIDGSADTGHNYLLPAGTTLYFDHAFPEGFIRYRVYVNVEGVDLPSSTLDDPTEVSPLTAYPVDRGALAKLLREYPLTKGELASILKSSQLSKTDINELLIEYRDQ